MSENIADLGGITLAIDAYHRSLAGKSAPLVAGLTGDQRVFLGWARTWREKVRDEALREQVATDEHAPGAWRTTMPIRNVQAWYDAYGVTDKDKQYLPPERRVVIW
jgi:putative endopeptidase